MGSRGDWGSGGMSMNPNSHPARYTRLTIWTQLCSAQAEER